MTQCLHSNHPSSSGGAGQQGFSGLAAPSTRGLVVGGSTLGSAEEPKHLLYKSVQALHPLCSCLCIWHSPGQVTGCPGNTDVFTIIPSSFCVSPQVSWQQFTGHLYIPGILLITVRKMPESIEHKCSCGKQGSIWSSQTCMTADCLWCNGLQLQGGVRVHERQPNCSYAWIYILIKKRRGIVQEKNKTKIQKYKPKKQSSNPTSFKESQKISPRKRHFRRSSRDEEK